MPFAVVLRFDSQTEERIFDVWNAIHEAGISSSVLEASYRPHISLGVCNRLEASAFESELSTFTASIAPFLLSLSSVGIFPGTEGVVFLGVTVTEQLLNIHSAFHKLFKNHAQEPWAYYAVGNWVPHCTIASGLSEHQIAQVVAVCRQISLPISAEVTAVGLVDVSPTSYRTVNLYKLNP